VQWKKIINRWRILVRGKVLFLPSSLHGGVEEWRSCPKLWSGRQWRMSRDTMIRASLSATDVCQLTHLALRRPYFSPDLATSVSSTSMWRPSPEIGTAGGCSPLS
jgi:hypothetical protein